MDRGMVPYDKLVPVLLLLLLWMMISGWHSTPRPSHG